MQVATRLELLVIAAAVAGVAVAASTGVLPARPSVGMLCLLAAATLLAQGLVRDVTQLLRARGRATAAGPSLTCMCVESTLGGVGVLAGALLVLAGIGGRLSPGVPGWTLGAAVVLLGGLVIRDLVIALHPLRIERIPGHGSIRVSLRPRP